MDGKAHQALVAIFGIDELGKPAHLEINQNEEFWVLAEQITYCKFRCLVPRRTWPMHHTSEGRCEYVCFQVAFEE